MKRIYIVALVSMFFLGCAASRRTAKLDAILGRIRILVKVDESLDHRKAKMAPKEYAHLKKEVKEHIQFLQEEFDRTR